MAGSRGRSRAVPSRCGVEPPGLPPAERSGLDGAGPGSAARRASGFKNVLLAALALSPRGHTQSRTRGVCAGWGRQVRALMALCRAICCALL